MKAKPGEITVATAGVTSGGHNAMEAISKATGAKYRHVTYDGGNPAVVATVGGETQVTTQLAVEQAEMIRAKRIRPLASITIGSSGVVVGRGAASAVVERHVVAARAGLGVGAGGAAWRVRRPLARAVEVGAEIIFKATKVDGIYTADPVLDPKAVRLSHITYIDALNRGLRVMDTTAITLCMENKLPIGVFNLNTPGNLLRIVCGDPTVGSYVSDSAPSPR